MSTALAALDLGPYRRLLQALLKGLAGIAVLDVAGTPVYRDDAMRGEPLAAGLTEWSVDLGRGDTQAGLGTLTARFAAPVDDAARLALAEVAAAIARECALVDELNAMAEELAGRYEELNMVYATEDQTSDFGQGQAMLQRLVKNYTQSLDIDLSVLLLPDKRICIVEHGPGQPLADADLIPGLLRTEVLPSLRAGIESLVLNTDQDAAAVGLSTGIPYKLLVQPILEDGSRVTGLLAAVNARQAPDFTNSDRNLLEVMARKAAKIILTNYDAATGLLLRAGFEHHLRMAVAKAQLYGEPSCVLGVDIDRMKVVNDTLGREAGDALIARVGELIREQVRDTDAVARLGSDDFGILLGNCSSEQGLRVGEMLSLRAGEMAFAWQGERLEVSLSIGVVSVDDCGESVEQILGVLDLACQAAKEQGLSQVQVYRRHDADLAARKEAMYWVGRLQTALREHRFRLHAQIIAPIVPAAHRVHYEVLIRLPGDDGRLIPPGAFIPPAERYGLMPAIDRWVFKRLLDDLSGHWREAGVLDAVFSVNLSGASLTDPAFLEYVLAELAAVPFPLDRLCFEITETAAIAKLELARQFIAQVRQMGCSFALDDFGSGLSSYTYLRNLDVDLVKIDGSFIHNILEDPVSDVMVQSVIAIARKMGIETVAEYVETAAILDRLRVLGVDFAQGYGVGMPTPLTDILAGLARFAASTDETTT